MRWCVVVIAALQVACDICDGPDTVGEATLRDQGDVDELEGVQCILGDLLIGSVDGDTVDTPFDLSPLEDLQIVEGDFHVSSTTQLSALELPSLTFVGRRGFDPDADRVRGGFFIFVNSALTELDLDALTDVGGCFEVEDNPLLDASDVSDLFSQVRSHAFPGTCDDGVEFQTGSGGR